MDYGQSDRADIQHRREQERDVRGAAKTIAQLALEMSHVHRLATLITEKADLLKDLAMRRKSYQDEVKESSKGNLGAGTFVRSRKPPGFPPPLPPHRPLLCPPLMAARLWRWIHKAAHRSHLELRSHIHSRAPLL